VLPGHIIQGKTRFHSTTETSALQQPVARLPKPPSHSCGETPCSENTTVENLHQVTSITKPHEKYRWQAQGARFPWARQIPAATLGCLRFLITGERKRQTRGSEAVCVAL